MNTKVQRTKSSKLDSFPMCHHGILSPESVQKTLDKIKAKPVQGTYITNNDE